MVSALAVPARKKEVEDNGERRFDVCSESGGLTEGTAVVNYIRADASFRCSDIKGMGGMAG